MLIAKTESGERIDARVADKGHGYYCQVTDEKVILKKGEINIHHFAHYPDSKYVHWENETEEHKSMKSKVLEYIKETNNVIMIELEYPVYDEFGYLVPDVYTELEDEIKVAIECQISHKSISDILAKTIRYSRMGIYTLWLFSSNDLLGYNRQRIRLPSMEREVYNIIGNLFVIENNKFGELELVRDGKLKSMFYCRGIFIDKPVLNVRAFNANLSDVILQERKDINIDGTEVNIKPLILKDGESYQLRLREVWAEDDKLYMIASDPFIDDKVYILGYVSQKSMHRFSYELSDGWHLKERFRNVRGTLRNINGVSIAWKPEYEPYKDTKIINNFKDLNIENATHNLLISEFVYKSAESEVVSNIQEELHISSSSTSYIDEEDLSTEILQMYEAGMSISDMAIYCDVSAGVIYDCIKKNNIVLKEKKESEGTKNG